MIRTGLRTRHWNLRSHGTVGILGLLAAAGIAQADPFVYTDYGDALLGFRKTGANQGNYELVVNIGSITNFENMAEGTSVTVGGYSPSQLSAAVGDYNNLNWSVSVAFQGTATWAGYPLATLWVCKPRTSAGVQTTPYTRYSYSSQTSIRQSILQIGDGARSISADLQVTNSNNTASLVREPINDLQKRNLTFAIADSFDPTQANYGGSWSQSVEAVTSANFTSPVVSDLYRIVPTGHADPTTGQTSGAAYFVGSFQLSPDGTMAFTRGSAAVSPPPAPMTWIKRSGNLFTISFASTNGATYRLYFTNSAGLKVPVTNWPSMSTTVTGDGTTNSFSDITTDPNRFYRVVAE